MIFSFVLVKPNYYYYFEVECNFNQEHLVYHCEEQKAYIQRENFLNSNDFQRSAVKFVKYKCETAILELELNPAVLGIFPNLKSFDVSSLGIHNLSFVFGPGSSHFAMKENTLNVVTLNTSHNRLKEIPQKIFEFTFFRNIDFSFNDIARLKSDDFRRDNRICKLNFAHNKIAIIEDGAFTTLQSLEILDLSHNPIKEIGDRLFACDSKIKSLNLRNTTITRFNFNSLTSATSMKLSYAPENIRQMDNISIIESSVFVEQKHLKYLDLSYNSLTNITSTTYTFKQLETINLNENQLKTIDSINPSNFPKLKSLMFGKNPTTCEYLEEFLKMWEESTSGSDRIQIHGMDCPLEDHKTTTRPQIMTSTTIPISSTQTNFTNFLNIVTKNFEYPMLAIVVIPLLFCIVCICRKTKVKNSQPKNTQTENQKVKIQINLNNRLNKRAYSEPVYEEVFEKEMVATKPYAVGTCVGNIIVESEYVVMAPITICQPQYLTMKPVPGRHND